LCFIARDLWKKKYFTEKKKTPALEEKVQELLNEIEGHQKKINQSLETDIKVAANEGYKAESEMKVRISFFLLQLKLI
jgi:hypothetical protein